MNEPRDRRVLFFLCAAIACFALVPVADEHWWVAALTGAVYCLLALGSALDRRTRDRQ